MIISVMSKDRPGIIADVTGAIYELKGDLADLNQSVLCGYLTMILIATFNSSITPEDAIVKKIDTPIEILKARMPEKTYILTAQGKNKSGLVYGMSSFCYERDINIMDLVTTLADDQYTMILQLDLSHIASIKDVRDDLAEYADKTGLRVVLQHNDIFRVTNEIAMI